MGESWRWLCGFPVGFGQRAEHRGAQSLDSCWDDHHGVTQIEVADLAAGIEAPSAPRKGRKADLAPRRDSRHVCGMTAKVAVSLPGEPVATARRAVAEGPMSA